MEWNGMEWNIDVGIRGRGGDARKAGVGGLWSGVTQREGRRRIHGSGGGREEKSAAAGRVTLVCVCRGLV